MNEQKKFDVPIAIIIYNRLDTAQKVMKKIQEIKPQRLYIISDASKKGDAQNIERVSEVRKHIENMVNWDCEVFKNYAEENMGCKMRVYSGISWVFEQEERAIILEDDVMPDISFFPYCDEMLEKYKDDERIMLVSGYNRYPEYETEEDYMFSCYAPIWGWATWRRAWKLCDLSMKEWPKMKEKRLLHYVFGNNPASILGREFDYTYDGEINTWDYQWILSILMNHGMGIVPRYNLVRNLGFGHELATHTGKAEKGVPVKKLEFPLKLRDSVLREYQYDEQISKKLYRVSWAEKLVRFIVPAKTLRNIRKYLERK